MHGEESTQIASVGEVAHVEFLEISTYPSNELLGLELRGVYPLLSNRLEIIYELLRVHGMHYLWKVNDLDCLVSENNMLS
jgi:hypothetical protein